MKTAVKVFSIIGGSLIVLGLLIAFISFSTIGFQGDRLNSMSDSEKKVEKFQTTGINTIQTDLHNQSVTIEESNTDEIVITYYTSEKRLVECEKNGDTIRIIDEEDKGWNINLTFDFMKFWFLNENKVIIEIPKDYDKDLIIQTSNSSIHLSDLIELSKVDMETKNGSITLSNINCDSAKLRTSNSSVTLTEVTAKGAITVDTKNGSVRSNYCTADEIEFSTSNSSIKLKEVTVNKKIVAYTSNGSIECDEVDSVDIRLRTSNSSIKGTIKGAESDYSITSRTSNASNNLPDHTNASGDKKLDVDTSNGSIKIEFTE